MAGRDDLALGGVFKYHRAGSVGAVHAQVVAAVETERGAIASVQLDQVVAAHYMARIVGHRDNEVEDDVVCRQIEEMIPVDEAAQAVFDDAEERV